MALWLINARRVARQAWLWMWWKLQIAARMGRIYFIEWWWPGWHRPCEILSTFLAEAAVLVVVFGPLDFLIASQNPTGAHLIAGPLVWRWSGILGLALLLASVWFAGLADHLAGNRKTRNNED